MMSTLDRAIEIAAGAHAGQTDRAGKAYILHPLRIMFNMKSKAAQIAAVLHDVVEDTDWTIERLKDEGFDEAVIEAVTLLTHDDGSEYASYIERLKTSPTAVEVKMGDLQDNMNLFRLDRIKDKDLVRIQKYHNAYSELLQTTKRKNG